MTSKLKPRNRIFIDNYGHVHYARSVADLAEQLGRARGTARRIYRDKLDGTTVHCGYVIGHYWCDEVARVEKPV